MRITLLFVLALTIVSCSSSSGHNPTVFAYSYEQQRIANQPIKKVILAPVSMGTPAPSYLQKPERKIKQMVKIYLESNGYEVLPNYLFDNAWKKAIRTHGNVYDPSSGRFNVNAWRRAINTTANILREQTDVDAIIFADLFEQEIRHSNSMQHYARWLGVTRKPSLRGSINAIPMGFDWSQPIKAASLRVTILDISLTGIFSSRGGIDTLYAVDLKRSNPIFVRRKSPLKNQGHIEEGIEIAFHPFIPMKAYPGNP